MNFLLPAVVKNNISRLSVTKTIKVLKSSSQIYSWRLKVDTKIKKWLKAGLNMYGHHRETSKPRISEYDGLIQQSMYFPSTIEPKMKRENITTTS